MKRGGRRASSRYRLPQYLAIRRPVGASIRPFHEVRKRSSCPCLALRRWLSCSQPLARSLCQVASQTPPLPPASCRLGHRLGMFRCFDAPVVPTIRSVVNVLNKAPCPLRREDGPRPRARSQTYYFPSTPRCPRRRLNRGRLGVLSSGRGRIPHRLPRHSGVILHRVCRRLEALEIGRRQQSVVVEHLLELGTSQRSSVRIPRRSRRRGGRRCRPWPSCRSRQRTMFMACRARSRFRAWCRKITRMSMDAGIWLASPKPRSWIEGFRLELAKRFVEDRDMSSSPLAGASRASPIELAPSLGGRLQDFALALLPGPRHALQDARDGPGGAQCRRLSAADIRAAEERPGQSGVRTPTSASAMCPVIACTAPCQMLQTSGRPLLPIHLHVDEVLVHDRRRSRDSRSSLRSMNVATLGRQNSRLREDRPVLLLRLLNRSGRPWDVQWTGLWGMLE